MPNHTRACLWTGGRCVALAELAGYLDAVGPDQASDSPPLPAWRSNWPRSSPRTCCPSISRPLLHRCILPVSRRRFLATS